MAFPRRMYTQSHVDYLAEVILYVNGMKDRIRGVKIVESPKVLRHFTAVLAPAHGSLIVEA
jgi:tryptophanase